MSRERWTGRAEGLVEASWLVAAGVVLLVALPYGELGLEAGRWLLARPLAALACGGALAAAWLRRGAPSPDPSIARAAGLSPLRLAAIAWGLAVAVATVASVDPSRSFWGEPPRLAGAFSLAAPFALFWLAAPRLASVERRERLATALLALGAALAAWALAEHLGLDVLALETLDPTRVAGPQGNPIFLAACLAALAPLALARALAAAREGRRGAAGAAGAIFALEALAAVAAGARAPLAGLVLGSTLVALGAATPRVRRRFTLGVLVAVAIALAAVPLAQPGGGALARLGGLADGTPATATQRLLLWRGTLSLLAADPLRAWIGHGPETLRRVLPPHLPEELPGLFFYPDLYHDRAHDLLLDEAAASGWPAAAALFALFTLAIGRALELSGLRVGRSTLRTHALASAVLAALAVALLGGLGRWELAVPVASVAPVAAAFLLLLWPVLRERRELAAPDAPALVALGFAGALAAGQIEAATGLRTAATWTLFFLLVAAVARPARRDEGEPAAKAERSRRAPRPSSTPTVEWLVALVPAAAIFSAWTPARVGGPSLAGVAALALVAALVASLPFARPLAVWRSALLRCAPYALLHVLLIASGASHLAIVAGFALAVVALAAVGARSLDVAAPDPGVVSRAPARARALALVAVVAPTALVAATSWRWIEAGVALSAGRTQLAQGKLADAERAFAAAAETVPEITAPEIELARLRMRRAGAAPAAERDRLFAEALAALDRAAARHPLDAEWRLQGGLLLARWAEASTPEAALRHRDAAVDRLREGVALEPTSAPLWRALGAVRLDADRTAEAIADLEAAVRRAPRSAEGRLLLARAWLAGGEWPAALAEARQALEIDRSRVVRIANGVARARPDDALAQLDAALVAAADGDRPGVALALERARAVAGPGDRRHVEGAARAFRAALGESP